MAACKPKRPPFAKGETVKKETPKHERTESRKERMAEGEKKPFPFGRKK